MKLFRLIICTVVMSTMLVCSAFAQTMRVTAYCEGDITASGEAPYIGGCACNDVPLGTTIYVNGNAYVVNDRMAWDGCVDIYMGSYDDCISFGVQYLDVEW